jgi:hypothetical protein
MLMRPPQAAIPELAALVSLPPSTYPELVRDGVTRPLLASGTATTEQRQLLEVLADAASNAAGGSGERSWRANGPKSARTGVMLIIPGKPRDCPCGSQSVPTTNFT